MKNRALFFTKRYYLMILFCLSVCIVFNTLHAQDNTFCLNLLTKKRYTPTYDKDFDIKITEYTPFIKVFLPPKEKSIGRAVIICPGGGYGMVAFGHEGTSWANFFNNLGIAAIVLKYRLPKGNYNIPIKDASTALQLVKDSANVWNININDIGIMGFSAGGHLASTIATHTKSADRPNFTILFYPVITMDKSYTHMGSHDSFLGKNADLDIEYLYSNEKQIDKDHSPTFIVLAADDKVVPPANSINYFEALIKNNIPASLHVYPTGNHGWGYNKKYKYNEVILSELSIWLNQLNNK